MSVWVGNLVPSRQVTRKLLTQVTSHNDNTVQGSCFCSDLGSGKPRKSLEKRNAAGSRAQLTGHVTPPGGSGVAPAASPVTMAHRVATQNPPSKAVPATAALSGESCDGEGTEGNNVLWWNSLKIDFDVRPFSIQSAFTHTVVMVVCGSLRCEPTHKQIRRGWHKPPSAAERVSAVHHPRAAAAQPRRVEVAGGGGACGQRRQQ